MTGVWGDFLLPHNTGSPVLMVAAGIGVTPFVSQLRHVRLAEEDRDIVLVYVASEAAELAFRDDIEASGIPVIVFTRDQPQNLPANWHWARGVRLDAEGLEQRADPTIRREHRRERNTRHGGRQREWHVDDRVDDPAPRKTVAHQRPRDDEAEHGVQAGGDQ